MSRKILKNAIVLTMNSNHELLENTDIFIENGIISEISPAINHKNCEEIDCSEFILMPGFINTHTHVAMSYMKGLADDLDLHTWLTRHIWPAEQKMLDFDFVYDASVHGICEMIKNGITCFNDMYFFENATAKACEKIGMRAVLGEGVIDFPAGLHDGSDSALNFIRELHRKYRNNRLINIAVAPHAVYTASKETWIKALNLAKELDLLLHFHLSETEKENKDFFDKNKMSPTEMLQETGVLNHKSVAAHAIHLSENDIEILAESRTSIAVCTKSNLKLISGFAPISSYEKAQINWSIATDGVSSNNNLDLAEEASLTAKLHKCLNKDPEFLNAEKMLRQCTIRAAEALGLEKETGSIEVGKAADIIFIDLNDIATQPIYDYYSQILYAMNSRQIRYVMINGKFVLKNRKLTIADEDQILAKARIYKSKILKITTE